MSLTLSCGPLTNSTSDTSTATKQTTVTDVTKPTTLSIDTGAAAGSSVELPANSVTEGTKVAITSGDAPESFASNSDVSAASSPIRVVAKDKNGNSVTSLSQPMTINIPVTGATLALATVEKKVDNLCAFLESADSKKYLWRKSSITITGKLATFKSTKLGTFMLAYCGEEKMDGFEESSSAGVDKRDLTAKLSVPKDDFYDAHHYCTLILGEDEAAADKSNNMILVSSNTTAKESGKDTAIVHTFDSTVVKDDFSYIVAFLTQDSTQTCTIESGKSVKSQFSALTFNRAYYYSSTAAEIRSGISETLGSGKLKVETFNLALGAPESMATYNISGPKEGKVCIRAERDAKTGIATATMINGSFADKKISAQTSIPITMMPGGDTNNGDIKIEITVGQTCQDDYADTDSTTGKPYRIYINKPEAAKSYYLTTTTITLNNPLGLPADGTMKLYSPSSKFSGDYLLSTYKVKTGNSYQVYLPYIPPEAPATKPIYDYTIDIGSGSVPQTNKELSTQWSL